jgi:hypothetical protein
LLLVLCYPVFSMVTLYSGTCCAVLQAYAAGDGKAAAEYSRKGRFYDELAKKSRARANDEVTAPAHCFAVSLFHHLGFVRVQPSWNA